MQAKVAASTASITLDPSSGLVGVSVTVSGSGFADSSAITATFGGSSIAWLYYFGYFCVVICYCFW